jgi:hypothetical protein
LKSKIEKVRFAVVHDRVIDPEFAWRSLKMGKARISEVEKKRQEEVSNGIQKSEGWNARGGERAVVAVPLIDRPFIHQASAMSKSHDFFAPDGGLCFTVSH